MRFNPLRTAWLLPAAFAAASAAGLVVSTPEGADAKVDPRVYDVKGGRAKVFGRRVDEWTADWWQWYWSAPAAVSATQDADGSFTEVGQRGPVWFLGAPSTSSIVVKSATIPSGTALLVPMLNVEWDALDPSTTTVDQMRVAAASFLNDLDPSSLQFSLDGVEIKNLERTRVASPVFSYAVPDANIYQFLGTPVGRGIFNPAVSDGYWTFLKPLQPGAHVVHFAFRLKPPSSYSLDVTWNLTVVDHTLP